MSSNLWFLKCSLFLWGALFAWSLCPQACLPQDSEVPCGCQQEGRILLSCRVCRAHCLSLGLPVLCWPFVSVVFLSLWAGGSLWAAPPYAGVGTARLLLGGLWAEQHVFSDCSASFRWPSRGLLNSGMFTELLCVMWERGQGATV